LVLVSPQKVGEMRQGSSVVPLGANATPRPFSIAKCDDSIIRGSSCSRIVRYRICGTALANKTTASIFRGEPEPITEEHFKTLQAITRRIDHANLDLCRLCLDGIGKSVRDPSDEDELRTAIARIAGLAFEQSRSPTRFGWQDAKLIHRVVTT